MYCCHTRYGWISRMFAFTICSVRVRHLCRQAQGRALVRNPGSGKQHPNTRRLRRRTSLMMFSRSAGGIWYTSSLDIAMTRMINACRCSRVSLENLRGPVDRPTFCSSGSAARASGSTGAAGPEGGCWACGSCVCGRAWADEGP